MNLIQLVEEVWGEELSHREKEYVAAILNGRKVLLPRCNAKSRYSYLLLTTLMVMSYVQGGGK